jgi:hypothetical protein
MHMYELPNPVTTPEIWAEQIIMWLACIAWFASGVVVGKVFL